MMKLYGHILSQHIVKDVSALHTSDFRSTISLTMKRYYTSDPS
jgi:hypothetical protein